MTVLFVVVPLAIVMAGVALGAFFWAVHRGQFDDLDTPRYRALFDDSDVRMPDHSVERPAGEMGDVRQSG